MNALYVQLIRSDILTNAHLFKSSVNEVIRTNPIPLQEYNQLKVKVYFNKPLERNVDPTEHPSTKRSTDTTKHCILAHAKYISHNHLDIALLQVEKGDIELLNQFLDRTKASHAVESTIGMPVWVIAHGFAPEKGKWLLPNIFLSNRQLGMDIVCSQGVLSNVILRDGIPASIQTSAAVHSGNSGGLLVNRYSNTFFIYILLIHLFNIHIAATASWWG